MSALVEMKFDAHWQRCVGCGIWFGVDEYFDNERRKDKRTFFCPNGHPMSFGEGEADRVRKQLAEKQRELDQERQRVAMERQMRIDTENTLLKERKEHKRQSKRIHAGVCPCCNRTFQNVARHMATKHPERTTK